MPALPGNCQIRDVLHLGTVKLQGDPQKPHSSGVSTKDIKLKSLTWDLQNKREPKKITLRELCKRYIKWLNIALESLLVLKYLNKDTVREKALMPW